MHGALQLALAVLSASVVLAAPTSNGLVKRGFQAHTNGRGVPKNPIDDINRVRRKYGWEIIIIEPERSFTTTIQPSPQVSITSTIGPGTSAIATSSATPTQSASVSYGFGNGTKTSSSAASTSTGTGADPGSEDGSVAAVPEAHEQAYNSPVTIGGQKFNLNFDTGSADLWVMSNKLKKSLIGQHAAFNPDKSSTWRLLDGETWSILYADNSAASGIVGVDTVDIGGSTVENQAIEVATTISAEFVDDPASDGLVGLAFSNINTVQPTQQLTFWENVLPDLSEPVFTADLEEVGGKGTYEFGTINKTKYSGDIHYTPVDPSNGWWEFRMPAYSIGGQSHTCNNCSSVIADTGTSLTYLEPEVIDAYFKQVKSAAYDSKSGVYTVSCKETLPDFGIQIGDYMAIIKGKDMFYAPSGDGSGTCWTSIASNTNTGKSILGDSVLKQFFAVFDGTKGKERFGIATKDGEGAATTA